MSVQQWFVILFVSGIHFIAFSHRMEVVPFFTELKEVYGVGYAEVGGLVSSFLLGYALFQIPAGTLADRYSPKWLILIGSCVMLIASLLFVFTESFLFALGLRFIMGASSAMLFSPGIKLISSFTPKEKRGLSIGILEGAAGIAMLLTLTLFPVLSVHIPRIYLYLALPFLLLPMLVLFWKLPMGPVPDKSQGEGGGHQRYSFLRLFRHSRVVRLFGISFFGMFGLYAFLAWLPTYLESVLGYAKQQVGWVMAIVMISQVIMAPVSGKVSDWMGERKGTLIVGSLMLACSACWLYWFSDWGIYFVAVLVGTGISWSMAPMLVLATEIVSIEMAGSVVSVMNTIGQLSSAASGYVYGKLFDITGNFQLIWIVCFAFLTVRTLCCLGDLEGKKRVDHVRDQKL
ncbi:MFS transporter [Aneurinibacillus tyrosinisolvens]|uniref:MFS transporter n=1 Tax=Aneurinibacillus tyrosinisolvens TaxID=1443435 RepID=UPI00063F963A|nr:MFS transporter [Aneurinibacillus tyrosinisolvens]